MSEVKRFTGDLMYGKPIESRDGVFVYAADFDRVTAERDAALGREAALARELEAESQGADRAAESLMEWRRDYMELQQRLTAADERVDVLEGLLREWDAMWVGPGIHNGPLTKLRKATKEALSASTDPSDECAHSYANKLGCPECGESFSSTIALDPKGSGSLGFDKLLAEYHAIVWASGEEGDVDYDIAGIDTAKKLQSLHRSALACKLKADERLSSSIAFVTRLIECAGSQPSIATGYLRDLLDALKPAEGGGDA